MKLFTQSLFAISLLLTFAKNSNSQAPKLDWLVTQQINPVTNTWELAQLRNNVYKAGFYTGDLVLNSSLSDTINSSNNGLNGSGFIVKYDTNGNYVKGVSLNAQANSLVTTNNVFLTIQHLKIHTNGNLIISGRLSGTAVITDTARTLGMQHIKVRAFVICLDSNLNYLWGKSLSNLQRHNFGGILPVDLSVDNNQTIYASFNIIYPFIDSGLIYGNTSIGVSNNGRDVILKINSNTGLLMNKYTEFNTGAFKKACIDYNGNTYYAMGNILYKRDSSFQFKWSNTLTTNNINFDEGSLEYYEGRLYLSCRVYGDFDGTTLLGKTYVLAQIDTATGNVIWKKIFTEPINTSQVLGKIFAKKGDLTLTGSFKKTLYFGADSLVATRANFYDIFIAKFDTLGNHLFSSVLSGPSSETSFISNEQGSNLYLSVRSKNTTNFVVDGASPVFPTNNFATGFAKYDISAPSVIATPTLNLGNDTTICSGSSLLLSSGLASSYVHLWNTTDTSSSISVNSSGQYWVQILDTYGAILTTDTINVTIENLTLFLGNDSSFNDSIILNSGLSAGSFLWNNASTSPSITIKSSGTYWLYYTSAVGCVYYDTITVTKNVTYITENSISQITLFPVPTYEYLNVIGLDTQKNVNYKIISQRGNEVANGELTNNSINVYNLKQGMYAVIFIEKGITSKYSFIKM